MIRIVVKTLDELFGTPNSSSSILTLLFLLYYSSINIVTGKRKNETVFMTFCFLNENLLNFENEQFFMKI